MKKITFCLSTLMCIMLLVAQIIYADQSQASNTNPALTDALIDAANQGDLEAVKRLINNGADVNGKNQLGHTIGYGC